MRARTISAASCLPWRSRPSRRSASGAHVRAAREQHHRLAPDRRAGGQLAADRQRRERSSSRRRTPASTVNVQYQTWGNHLQKFDATLAGGNAPDVIEMGNTEMTKYMAAGAFQDLTSTRRRSRTPPPGSQGLAASGRYGGKTTACPYYAGSRVVTYRTDLFKKAGVKVPTSLAQFTAAHAKLARRTAPKGLLARLHRRHGLVLRDELRLRLRRSDRAQVSGKWKGNLASPKSRRRARRVQDFFNAAVAGAARRRDETQPQPVRRVRAGPGRLDRRPGLVQLLRGQEVQGRDEAVRDAEPHEGPGDAGLPRRLRPRRADRRQQGAGARLDQRLHEHADREGPRRQSATSRTRRACSARASTSGRPSGAGSSRRRRTGSTSRTAISSATCSRRSSPASSASSRPPGRRATTSRRS